MTEILAYLLAELAAVAPPRAESTFLMERGWLPLGKNVSTGIRGWGKVINRRAVTVDEPEALTMEGYGQCHVVNRRKAPFDVYIGRPGPWGNPFSHMPGTLAKFRVASRDEAISRFREWFLAQPELVARAKRELKGKVLGCWCKPASCHGDVIAEVVNEAK